MSELALRLIEENKKTRATFLDLGNCGLTEVPEEIRELVWLEELSFAPYRWEWDVDEVWWTGTTKKTENLGSANNICRLTPSISGDRPLKNPFSHLKNLKLLHLNSGSEERNFYELTDLSPLAVLTNLQWLDIFNTQVADLSPLERLKNLQTLDISNTRVADLSPLTGLNNLQMLNISGTQVTDLFSLANLPNLQLLLLSDSQIANLEPLAKLDCLQVLSIRNTQVTDLSPLSRLISLKKLQASETQVSDLSPLAGLINLQKLLIFNTRVKDLYPLLPIIMQGISVDWGVINGNICVLNCPLTNPPVEIVKQGNEAILRYFAEKERAGTIKVREAKLLLVGQGKAGKTSLKIKLQDPHAALPAPGDSTRGIAITGLDEKMPQTGEPLLINVWDFGGQDIQHYAHQFFLTGNALYALVTNERIQDAEHLPYWLNIIEMLGKKSPILLVQNKEGDYCQPLKQEAAIRARFGNVHNRVFQTDLSQAAIEPEFAELRREIIHQAAQLPHVERDYLTSFAELRSQLESKANQQIHYLHWQDYRALMPELSEELLRDYANALTFLGVCQYFPDDAHLSQFVFLRPKWIIDALFALLLHPMLESKRGYFSEKDTFAIWQAAEYQGMHALLVRMMEEFELCYRVEGDRHTYILPQRLPDESHSYGWDEAGDTVVQYRYKFMPKGILTRLICRMHQRIETDSERGQRVWCDAVILTLPDGKGRVFAREVYSENIIELRAAGVKQADILNETIRNIDDINSDAKYDNLQVDKLVPCPCVECGRAETPGFHEFDALQRRIDKGKTTSECKKSGEDVPIDEIFGKSGVKRPVSIRGRHFYNELHEAAMVATPLRIFISYSHAQRDYFPIFKAEFIQYAKFPGLAIEVFGDDEIPTGTVWDDYLQSKVADCDVMVLLVSQEFMNSPYIQEKEFGAAVERLKAGRELLIAPIYFAPCQFTSDAELARLQFFKPHGDMFDKAQKGDRFAYIDLVKFRESDGQAIPNSNRQHYMMELMKKLEPELRKLRQ